MKRPFLWLYPTTLDTKEKANGYSETLYTAVYIKDEDLSHDDSAIYYCQCFLENYPYVTVSTTRYIDINGKI